MSPLTNHTVSRELAIALREAGWPQPPKHKSIFYWNPKVDGSWAIERAQLSVRRLEDTSNSSVGMVLIESVAAPTASELMERMNAVEVEGRLYWLAITKGTDVLYCASYEHYHHDSVDVLPGEVWEENICEALAKLALFLVKEGKMKF